MVWNSFPGARSVPGSHRSSHCTVRLTLEPLEDRLTPATLPAGFSETVVASGLVQGTTMEFAPDGKLFVADQGGTLPVFQDGSRLQEDFFSNTPLQVNAEGERGLLGIAFDPNYATNRFVYVYYTASMPDVHNRLSRFTANATGTLALAGSEQVLIDLPAGGDATNHNGGAIHFGPDGKLYVAVGDRNIGPNSQSLNTPLGKILRINADSTIPTDNPFFNQTTGINRAIWALGLRNPFTFSFQPGTGRMFINDVGAASFEEINEGLPGGNYGWPNTEGPTNNPAFQTPFSFYSHDEGCAITGGAFYNPTNPTFPASFTGDYFFADFCEGDIRRLDLNTRAVVPFASDIALPVDLRVDNQGNLYYLERGSGQVFQVQYNGTRVAPTTTGTFDPFTATWYLRSENSAGSPDVANFGYGGAGWRPVVGDWNSNGIQGIGVVDPEAQWYLRNTLSSGFPEQAPFGYGLPWWTPVAGNWNGLGSSGIGQFDPFTGTWYLRTLPGPGAPDIAPFNFGAPGWIPVVGDWDGNGTDTVGAFDPLTATWYLRNSNTPGFPDLAVFSFGGPGWQPVVGDWDGDGITTVGVVDFNGTWYLRNSNSQGGPDTQMYGFGLGSWRAVPGVWMPLPIDGLRAPAQSTTPSTPLSEPQLQAAVAGALARLEQDGVDPAIVQQLALAQYALADLPGTQLGWAREDEGVVWLDRDAAGHGWFVDPTPLKDEEFGILGENTPAGMDLLTAVLHEMAHLRGQEHQDEGLLTEVLPPGTRRVEALNQLFRS